MNRFSDRTLAVAVGSDRSGVIETANNSDYTFIYDEKLADDIEWTGKLFFHVISFDKQD